MKANAQNNTLLKAAKGNAASNFFKRVFFSPAQEEFQIFSPSLQKKIKTPQRTVLTWTDIATNVNRFGQSVCRLDTTHLWTERRAAHNSTYPKGGVSCSKDSLVGNGSSVFQIKFCGKSPALRVAAKRQTV